MGVVLFRLLLGIDVLAASVAVYFFLWGLMDGTVSSYNIGIWLLLLGGLLGVLAGGMALRARGRLAAANLLLLVLGVPAIGVGLIVLIMIVNPPHWQ